MTDKPHLIHRGERITTDATLRADLEASLRETAPIKRLTAEVRVLTARVETLERVCDSVNNSQIVLLDAIKELVTANKRVMDALANVVARANSVLDLDVKLQ